MKFGTSEGMILAAGEGEKKFSYSQLILEQLQEWT